MSVRIVNFRNNATGEAVSGLCFGPLTYIDFIALRTVQANADNDRQIYAEDIERYGYDFNNHLFLTKAVNKLSLDLSRVKQTGHSEYPAPDDFKDLRHVLGQLRSFWQIEFMFSAPDKNDTAENISNMLNIKEYYSSLVDRIRSIEDKLEDYRVPSRASVTALPRGRWPT